MNDVTIRGILVRGALTWIKKHAPARVIPEALASLPVEDRALFSGLILPFQKFPLAKWDRLLSECTRLGAEALEIPEALFDRRMIYQGGSDVMKLFFNAMVTLFDLDAVVKRLPQLHTRTYEPATCTITAQTKTSVALTYTTSSQAAAHYRHYQALMLGAILETCGAKDVTVANAGEEYSVDSFSLTIEARYRPMS